MEYCFHVHRQRLIRRFDEDIVSSSRNEFYCRFCFDENWNGIEPKTVNFEKDDIKISVRLDNNDRCLIPWEMTEKAGYIKIQVVGGDLVPTGTAVIRVAGEPVTEGLGPTKASPGMYGELVKEVDDLKERIDRTEQSIEIITDEEINALFE